MPRILIIDDDPDFRDMLKMTLLDAGFEVDTASNGWMGLEKFHQSPGDLVISDIIMPVKEGLETIGTLRQSYPNLKILAISGGGRTQGKTSSSKAAIRLGANRFLAKPFLRKTLLSTIRQLLEPERADG